MPRHLWSPISDTSLKAMNAGLAFARSSLQSDQLDSDEWLANQLPASDRTALLEALLSDQGLDEKDLELHLGESPIPADRQTHTVMAGVIRRHIPTALVVGEEAREDEWNQAQSAESGYIFSIDPIDGSVPYSSLTFGYSSNVLVHRRWPQKDYLLLSAVANSSGATALYEEGTIYVGDIHDRNSFTIVGAPLDDPLEGSVALLGALPRHRAKVRGVLQDQDAIVFTTGGAPASLGLVVGSLESLIASSPQTLHDAAFLPILASLHLTILTQDGRSLGLPEVLSIFERVARSKEARIEHPCPAFVASRSPERAYKLRSEMGWN